MKTALYEIMIWFQSICMLLSLFFSLRLINNKNVISYMKYFYWYSIIGGTIVILRIFSKSINFPSKIVMGIISNYSILFHFLFLSIFISTVIQNKKILKIAYILPFIFTSTTIFALTKFTNEKQNSTAFAIANLGLICCCILYYYYLFKDVPKLNLLKEPAFWIVSGIFFCMSATIPILSLHEHLHNEKFMDSNNRRLLSSVNHFVYGTMHLFFIKGYQCSITRKKMNVIDCC